MPKLFEGVSPLERSMCCTPIATTCVSPGAFCNLPESYSPCMFQLKYVGDRLNTVVLPRLALGYLRRLRRHGLVVLAPVCVSAAIIHM